MIDAAAVGRIKGNTVLPKGLIVVVEGGGTLEVGMIMSSDKPIVCVISLERSDLWFSINGIDTSFVLYEYSMVGTMEQTTGVDVTVLIILDMFCLRRLSSSATELEIFTVLFNALTIGLTAGLTVVVEDIFAVGNDELLVTSRDVIGILIEARTGSSTYSGSWNTSIDPVPEITILPVPI